jgi:hypothetical protein
MTIVAGKYTIENERTARKGAIWNVRVYKKGLLKRLVSSDWFLDEKQSHEYAQRLADELKKNSTIDFLNKRKPGWTLPQAER